ncbi:HDOD domain-containing protein [bacterium]|nr:HDOD domain-containing protein [bacterium]
MNRANDILNQTDRFPNLPENAQILFTHLCADHLDQSQIVQVIEANPDSIHYVMRIDQALQPMNFDQARTLQCVIRDHSLLNCIQWALTGCLQPIFCKDHEHAVLEDLFLHSLSTAICAVILEKECKLPPQVYLFLSGLLHDAGLAVLVQHFGIDFSETIELAANEEIAIDEAERKRLGCDHGEIGAASVAVWSQIQPIIDVAKYHHRPDHYDGPYQQLVDTVHIADMMSRMVGIGIGNEGLSFHTSVEAEKRIGFTPEIEENVIFHLLAGMEVLQGDAF